MNKKWRKFKQLTEKCYDNMIGANQDSSCWEAAFGILKEIVAEERKVDSTYARELYLLDDETDFEYDIQGWLEDCLDELDMGQRWEELLGVCTDMLDLFEWKEDSASQYHFMKISALGNLGRNEEAVSLSRVWLEKEEDNMLAVTAGIYANMNSHDYEEAERLIQKNITEDTECTDENDVLFIAAEAFYEASGNEKEKKRVEKILEEYDKRIEQEMMELGEDDELPFL